MRSFLRHTWAAGLCVLGLCPSLLAHEVSGRVRLVRPDGVVATNSDGFAILRTRAETSGKVETIKASIEGGRWSAQFPDGWQFQVKVIRVDAGDCYPVAENRWMPLPVTGHFDLDVRILQSFALKVYGADGRTELDDVVVVRKRRADARLPHPDLASSKTEVVTAPSPSPVDIRVTTPERYVYFARAPGYAWSRVEVDPFLGGVLTLQLEPGGELDIQLTQLGPERGKVLRLRRHVGKKRELYLELKRYDSQELMDGLPIGAYTITSEEPIRPDNMPVYGSTEALVVAGETSSYQLEIARNPTFVPAPVAGKLFVPEAWGDVEALTVVLTRIDRYGLEGRYYEIPGSTFEVVDGVPRTFAWSLEEVMPGGFDVQVRPLSTHAFREVHGGGNRRLNLDVPEPREITVRVIDERSGDLADVDTLRWRGHPPQVTRSKIKGLPPIVCEDVLVMAETPGLFRFRAPQQPLILRLDSPAYLPIQADLDAQTTEAKPWSARRTTGLRLRLLHNGEVVEWKGDAAVSAQQGDGQVIGSRRFGEFRQYDVSAQGSYRVELPIIPGYGQVPRRTVELVAGEVLEFDVLLNN